MFNLSSAIALRFSLAGRLTSRGISTSLGRKQESQTPAPGPKPQPESDKGATHKPSAMDRKYLVWSGKYKTEADIPEYVHAGTMERANNRTRIRIANIMIVATIFGCIVAIISGKSAAESGDSVQKQNLDWHKQYNASKEPAAK